MNFKTALLGFIGSIVVAASAHAETPLFATGSAASVLGKSSDWSLVSFSTLSAFSPALFSYELISEQTSHAATQTFAVNGKTVFAGSASVGATASSAGAITFGSFAFDSQSGSSIQKASTANGHTFAEHAGDYAIYESKSMPKTFALAYEDDFNIAGNSNDYQDMVVRMSVAAVPEPETYAMMVAGLGALAFVSRRRRRAA